MLGDPAPRPLTVAIAAAARALRVTAPLCLIAACSEAAPPPPPASASASAASSTANASTSASTPVSTSPTGDVAAPGVALDATWVVEDPRLTDLLYAASPPCVRSETFDMVAPGLLTSNKGRLSHSYDVYAPSQAATDLDARFRARAADLKLELKPARGHQMGVMIPAPSDPENSGTVVWMEDARVMLVTNVNVATEPAIRRARAMFSSWPLVEQLGGTATWKRVSFEHGADGGFTLNGTFVVPEGKASVVAAWAAKLQLEKDGEAWLRRVDKKRPEATSILAEIQPDGTLQLLESRASTGKVHAACADHPKRGAATTMPSAPPRSPSAQKRDEDDLLREMMRE